MQVIDKRFLDHLDLSYAVNTDKYEKHRALHLGRAQGHNTTHVEYKEYTHFGKSNLPGCQMCKLARKKSLGYDKPKTYVVPDGQ